MTEPHDRQRHLGGSDAAAVMGLSPWATPVELWMQKTGRAVPKEPDAERQKLFRSGHRWEPVIREMTIERLREDMGLDVELITFNKRHYDPEHPWLSVEVDFELKVTGTVVIGNTEVVFDNEHINADAKTVSSFVKRKWGPEENTEDVPIEYAAQFMTGLMVTGRRYCLVAALSSVHHVNIYWTVRDDETIAAMRPKLVDFWVNHVLANVAPDPFKFSDIKLLFPLDDGQAIEATPEIAAMVDRLRDVKSRMKDLEVAEEVLTFDIARFISPHSLLRYEGRDLLSWCGQRDTRMDVDAFRTAHPDLFAEFSTSKVVRVLRFVKPKKGTR